MSLVSTLSFSNIKHRIGQTTSPSVAVVDIEPLGNNKAFSKPTTPLLNKKIMFGIGIKFIF